MRSFHYLIRRELKSVESDSFWVLKSEILSCNDEIVEKGIIIRTLIWQSSILLVPQPLTRCCFYWMNDPRFIRMWESWERKKGILSNCSYWRKRKGSAFGFCFAGILSLPKHMSNSIFYSFFYEFSQQQQKNIVSFRIYTIFFYSDSCITQSHI